MLAFTVQGAVPKNWPNEIRAYLHDFDDNAIVGASHNGWSGNWDLRPAGSELELALSCESGRVKFCMPSNGQVLASGAIPAGPLQLFFSMYRDGNAWQVRR